MEEQKVIDLKLQGLDENIKEMIELQKFMKLATDSIKAFEKAGNDIVKFEKILIDLKKAGKENTAEYKNVEAQLQSLTKTVKAGEQANINNIKVLTESKQILKEQKVTIQETIRAQNKQVGSIVELRTQEKLLQQEYINLSRAERESAKGTEMQDSLRAIRTEINKAGMAAGDYRANVGNYANSITDAVGKMGGFGPMAQKMKGGFDTIKLATTGALGPIRNIYDRFDFFIFAIFLKARLWRSLLLFSKVLRMLYLTG